MSSMLDGVTNVLVSKALDVAALNHAAIANNVANVNTEGYRPLGVSFDAQLQQLADLVMNEGSDTQIKSALNDFNPEILPTSEEAGVKVMLDEEIVKMTKNTVHYEALLTAKSKLGSILKMAISGERG